MYHNKIPSTNEIVFLTFGAGNIRWNRAAKRLKHEAEKLHIFSQVYALDENWHKMTQVGIIHMLD